MKKEQLIFVSNLLDGDKKRKSRRAPWLRLFVLQPLST
jgi:hypothetical protein